MKFDDMHRWERLLVFAAAALMILLFFAMNALTPVQKDDWSYCVNFVTKERIASFGDIFQSLGIHYARVNGRLPVHFLAHLFLWMGKGAFNLINTAAFSLLIALVCCHAFGSFRGIRPRAPLFVFCALWALTPAFGESFLWVTGACNYLWGMLLILSYLVPFRRAMESDGAGGGWRAIPAAFLGGVLAGWTNENTGCALVLLIALMIFIRFLEKKPVPVWFWAGLAGSVAGLLLMLLAPGELGRLDGAGGVGGLGGILRRALSITYHLLLCLWPCILLWIGLLIRVLRRKTPLRELFLPIAFLLAGLASAYSMAFPPAMPDRVWSGPILFFLIFTLLLWRAAGEPLPKKPALRTAAAGILAAAVLISGVFAAKSVYATRAAFLARENDAERQLAEGERVLILDAVKGSGSRFDAAEPDGDLTDDPDWWLNTALARRLGADAVRTR